MPAFVTSGIAAAFYARILGAEAFPFREVFLAEIACDDVAEQCDGAFNRRRLAQSSEVSLSRVDDATTLVPRCRLSAAMR